MKKRMILMCLGITLTSFMSCQKESFTFLEEEPKYVVSENNNNSSNNNEKNTGGKKYQEKACTFTDSNGVRRAGVKCTSESSGLCKKEKDCTSIDKSILLIYFHDFDIDTWDRTNISENIEFMTYLSEEYPEDFYTP